ncbi:hemicentin-2-like [Babylonia areolata]|uniref:hemicentin-2-like n=1 Tax=Babylonia areolata TaxID=304850 RepID=UPI003FD0FFED
MASFNTCLAAVVLILPAVFDGVVGQTVISLVGGTAVFTDVPIPGTGTITVRTANGEEVIVFDIFGNRIQGSFQGRLNITSYTNGFRNGRASFIIRNVRKSDAGAFLCGSQFEGVVPCGSAILIVPDVPSKPTIAVLTDTIIVGNDVVVECQSSSNSAPKVNDVLRLVYNLKENGRLALENPTQVSRFKISSITKAKKGFRYSCVAYEVNTQNNQLTGLASQDSEPYVMNPLYPPETPVLTPPDGSYAVSSGDVIPDVKCTSDCNPPCNYNWFKGVQIFQSGATLSLGSVDKTDAGNYFCRARNTLDFKDAPVIVTVQDNVSTPELVPPTPQYTVREGATIDDVVCRAQCTPACTYIWVKDGQRVSDSDRLSLGVVSAATSGTYTCRVTNGQDTREVSLEVDVQYPPKKPAGRELISPSSRTYTVEEGALVLPDIVCDADCNPLCQILWTDGSGRQVAPGQTLSLGAASRQDTGLYTCTASNSLGQLTDSVDVDIQFKPEQITFDPSATSYRIREGVDVLPDIRCDAICNPECRYGWNRDDDLTRVSESAVLSLNPIRRQDAGSITCKASNPYGDALKSVTIDVRYGPDRAILSPAQTSYTIPSGSVLPAVTCSADCNPPCTFRWVKDDSSDAITTLATLTLGQADRSTAGIYKCVATNDHASANAKFELAVQFGPNSTLQLQPPQNSHDLSEGDDLIVTCSASCDPACSFRWEDNSGGTTSGDGTLRLLAVTPENAGVYTCVADNGLGTPARRSIDVNVLIGPTGKITITPPQSVVPIKEGNSVVLTCSAECSPSCTLAWRKGTQELTSNGGILTLNDVSRDQDGSYTCEATNPVATATKSVRLEVQYGPGTSITFSPDKATQDVEEKADLSVTCSADCRPECGFVWLRGSSTQVSTGPVLSLDSVQRDQSGVYSCTADNVVKQPMTKQITVDVLYGPSEVRLFPNEQQLYPIQGSSVSLKCWAECNPPCTYAWLKGSTRLPEAVQGELDLRDVNTASSGNYVCVASNDRHEPASRSVDINVRTGPGTTIRFSPPDDVAVVTEGRQFKVECIAECSPACRYEWRKGAELITNQSTLEFGVTDREKAGSYICFASNDASSQASKPLSLDVQYGPGDSISLFPPGQNQSYMEGAPFNIKCSAECQPTCSYNWFLGARLLPYQDGVLSSDSARQDQAGTYTCQAGNGVGSTSTATVVVDIQTGPGSTITFTPPGDSQVIREGEDLLVRCSADCVPACTYTWLFGTQELDSVDGRLELRAVDRAQKGTYSCVADNGFGNQGTKPLNVAVRYGPEGAIEVFPNASSHILNEGGSLSLKCSADCSPKCDYTWYLGNEVARSSQGVLSLVAVGPGNAGTYRCSAENSIGLASSGDITVVVKTGPGNSVKIEPEGDVYNVTEGRQLRLKCSAECSPACTYTWYYGFERVTRADGVLVIDDVMRNASGPFVCSAANDVGLKGSKMIKVNVLYGPSDGVTLDPANNVTVVMDQPFTLRCSANCLPPCIYTWFLGPLPKESAGGKLDVRRAGVEDGGSYKCRASNDVGAVLSDPVLVEVHYGPRDSIQFEPEGSVYTVMEGDDVTVTCSADCKPECEYSWFAGVEAVVSEDGKLVIPKYTRSMPRFFSCFANNGLTSRAMLALEIQVQYGPGDKAMLFPSTSPITTTVGGAVSVQCTADCSPECTYTWTKGGEVIFTRVPGILQLPGVVAEQAGTYVCSAQNGVDAPATASVDLEILSGQGATIRFVPPGLTASVLEGEPLRVGCTANCVPECEFVWTRAGQVVSSNSLLLLVDTARDTSGVYQCHAHNDLGVNVTQQLAVTVHYGPKGTTRLFPPDSTRNLNRGDTLTVQCSAQCSPPCSYKWRKGALQLPTEEGVLLVPNVTPDDRGRYTCTAINEKAAPESVSLAVNVNFGPEDTITFKPPGNSQSILEGETLEVTCSADCLPTCSYTWYLASRRLETTEGVLEVSDVTRDDAGTYTCHADNGVGRRMTEDLLVDVLYPPSTPTFQPPTTSYTVRERIDSVGDVRCFSACNPRCQVSWLKDGVSLDTVGNVLSLNTPNRSADGVYSCLASNDHGSRQKDLTIRVNYAPTITVFAINDAKTMATVPEKYPVTLNCRVDSQPPSTILLFNGSRLLQEVKDKRQAKLQWKQAECLDAGRYSCEADNGVGAKVSLTADLKVLCSPRLDPRVFFQPYVAGRLGQTAAVRVHVLAYPPPSFLWYKVRGGEVLSSPSSAILVGDSASSQGQSDKFFKVNGSVSTLTIENVQLADFGDYVVRMINSQGSANYTLSLVPQSAPYPARDLSARPINAKTVELTWSPGFNGGARQQFLLEYRKPGTNGWLILELDAAIDDVTPSVSQNVTDLSPSTPYVFRLRSRNLHGLSNYSGSVRVVTSASREAEVSTGDVSPTPVLMGVGLALGFLVGAGITAIVVVSRCRPRPRKHGENTIDDFRSDTTYDTLYLRDALWAQRHIKMRQNGGSISGRDGYDYKQPEDTVRGYNDYTSALKPVSEMRTSL